MSGTPQALDLNPDVVCSPLADGGVLFDLATKQYYALNATGLLVWQVLEDGAPLGPLVAQLEDRYAGSSAETLGVHAFGAHLVALGLAAAAADGRASVADPPQASTMTFPAAWVLPAVTPHGRPLSKVILSPFDPTVPVPE